MIIRYSEKTGRKGTLNILYSKTSFNLSSRFRAFHDLFLIYSAVHVADSFSAVVRVRRAAMGLAVFPWRHPSRAAEHPRKVIAVVDAHLVAYLVDAHLCPGEHAAGLFHLPRVQIAERTLARLALEERGKMARRVARIACYGVEGEAFFDVLLHVVDGCGDHVAVVNAAGGIAERAQIAHRGQIVVEHGRDIAQAVKTVSGVERVEYLLKDVVAVVYARVGAGPDVLRDGGAMGVEVGVGAGEMDPIDCPGIGVVGSVGVGTAGGKDEELVCRDRVGMAADAVPSGTVGTVYQHVLADGFRPLAAVASGMRIISDVGHIEA